MKAKLILPLLMLSLSPATIAAGQPAHGDAPLGGAAARARAATLPRVDHHQHLLGPTALPAPFVPLSGIEVPEELKLLLKKRATLASNSDFPAEAKELYTQEAQAISWGAPSRWVRGRDAVREAVKAALVPPFEFVPNAYSIRGDAGHIAGSLVQGTGASAQAAVDFLFVIERGSDRRWRIAAETMMVKTRPLYWEPLTGAKVVGELDEAGMERAIVLSVAFWLNSGRFPDPKDELTREYDAVRAENDWVASQAALFPSRLVMACSANVLRAYAIRELERCSTIAQARAFKLHLADADLDLRKPDHLAKLRQFFEVAERLRMPLIVHFAPRFRYDRSYVELFLSQVMTAAPNLFVQIAHLGGDGPGIDHPDGTAAFAEAVERRDPRARNLYFDIAGLVTRRMTKPEAQQMASLMRRIGLDRILYASDGQPPNRPTGEHWIQTRQRLPLTEQELKRISSNVAPYMRAPRMRASSK